MTEEQLKEIEARANAASPSLTDLIESLEDEDCHLQDINQHMNEIIEADMFIAHARTDIPVLVAEVQLLREALRQIQQDPYDADRVKTYAAKALGEEK